MLGETISHYKILEKLGEGGMGVVYRAHDTILERDVALKLLRPHLSSDPEAVKRFVQEAKAASALNHSAIGVIYEIDKTADDQTFIAMALYEGGTLREKIDSGDMTTEEAVAIASQIASGLDRAYEKGIVHRDIKPQNILLTRDGEAKIIDFGLAKLAGKTKLTRDGSTLGTAAYMSPEQARGEEVDHRSDVFSLGTILYEMLAGETPFKGEHEAALLYGIVHEEPETIIEKCEGIDLRLCEVIEKALEKDPAERYQLAGEMKNNLREIQPSSTNRAVTQISAPKAAGGKPRRNLWIGLAAIVIIAAVIGYLMKSGREPGQLSAAEMTLAVFDFKDLATEPDPMLSKSITALLNTALVEFCPIRVQSPERVRECRRQLFGSIEAQIEEGQELEIARRSEATYLLTGNISIVSNDGFISWRLIDVVSGTIIKAGTVEPGEMMSVADKIVEAVLPEITDASRVERTVEQVPVAQISTSSPRAYEHYLRGKIEYDIGRQVEALSEFTKAVELDSSFALAWFAMSRLYGGSLMIRYDPALRDKYREIALRHESRMGIKERMQFHALGLTGVKEIEKLKEILDLWPDDRETLQMVVKRMYWYWMYKDCIKYCRIGLALYPKDPVFGGGSYIEALNDMELSNEAMEASKEWINIYPDEPAGMVSLARTFMAMGQPDSAEAICRIIVEKYPEGGSRREAEQGIAQCAYLAGNLDESISRYERLLSDEDLDESTRQYTLSEYAHEQYLPYVYREAGRYSAALRTMNEARPYFGDSPERWELQMGFFLVDTGNNEDALRLAEEMLASGSEIKQRYARRFIGKAQVEFGDIRGARETVSRLDELALISGPWLKHPSYLTQAYIAMAKKDAAMALEHLDNAADIMISPNSMFGIELKRLQAEANELAGDLEVAVSIHQNILRINGGHALSHFELGKLYEKMNRPEDAKRHYEKFLEMWKYSDEGLPQPDFARERLKAIKGA